jgi:hypothetical protein
MSQLDTIKLSVIDQIEDCVRRRKKLEGKEFESYPGSFKQALMEESLSTLRSDLKAARKSLDKVLNSSS